MCSNCSGDYQDPDMTNEPDELTDALGRDTFDAYLEDCWLNYRRLRATRDTQAIAASNANTRMLIDALKGKL